MRLYEVHATCMHITGASIELLSDRVQKRIHMTNSFENIKSIRILSFRTSESSFRNVKNYENLKESINKQNSEMYQ